MTKFEDQLYADLIHQHGHDLAGFARPTASRRAITPRRVLIATGAGGVAVAAAVGVLTAGGGAPSYALTTSPDGTLTLAVYQSAGIAPANAKLRELGDNVVVVPVKAGCPSLSSLPAPAVTPTGPISVGGSGSSSGSITVDAHGVPAGDIIVVGVETSAQGVSVAGKLTSPPAPSCVSLPSQTSGNGGPGDFGFGSGGHSSHGGTTTHGSGGPSTHSKHSSSSGRTVSSSLS
jgi:hypothetical protein